MNVINNHNHARMKVNVLTNMVIIGVTVQIDGPAKIVIKVCTRLVVYFVIFDII